MILRVCICIPTYNNPRTIADVVEQALSTTEFPVLVVDDGSDVPVSTLLSEATRSNARLEIQRFESNQGKGVALRRAFERAVERGFTHLVTMDGDGQHLHSEIPKLVAAARANPWDMIIGHREMGSKTVPGISKFGRKFSNFWVGYQTGLKVLDSQSGFRIYPLFHVQGLRFWSKKFDFEIEVLIRLIWKGVNVAEVPIKVYYPEASERVSHFDKLWDNVRISTLNTVLVVMSLMRSHQTPTRASLAIGFGIFIGCTPLFGFHTFIAGALAFFFRLNFLYVWAGTQISIPPLAPFLAIASLHIGEAILGAPEHTVGGIALDWMLGSLVVGAVLGLAGSLVTFFTMHRLANKKGSWNGKTRGGRFGNGFLKILMKNFGVRPVYFCLYFIIPYFYFFAPKARRSANEYWKLQRPDLGFWKRQITVLKHLFRFGQVLTDRLFQSFRKDQLFRSRPNGLENITNAKKGLIMLGGHIGAWDLSAALLPGAGLTWDLHVVHYESNGLTFNKLKGASGPEKLHSLVSNAEAQPVLKIRDILGRGLPIGLMGDRPISHHFELVPFLGKLAPFDTTPFRLAASCDSELLFTFGFRGNDGIYDFFATPARTYTYDPKIDRSIQCLKWVEEFASSVEFHLKKYPEQWFNFFPFWSAPPGTKSESSTRHNLLEELSKPRMATPGLEFAPTTNVSPELQA